MKLSKVAGYILVAAVVSCVVEPTPSETPYVQKATNIPSDTSAVTLFTNLPATGAPIAIVDVLLDKQPIAIGSPFAVSGNWVSKIHVIVRNISPRPIVAGSATLVFTETGNGTPEHPIVTAGMSLGRPPETAFRQKDGTIVPLPASWANQDAIVVLPGATMEFHSVTYPGGILGGDAEQKAAYDAAAGRISRATIDLRNFYFADGSKWTGYSYLEPIDPPALWKQISADQFLSGPKSTP